LHSQLPFVDFYAVNRPVEASELRVTFHSSLRLEAAAALLGSFNWNRTILFWSPQRRSDAELFQTMAAQKGMSQDVGLVSFSGRFVLVHTKN
jgi:hypothetical protein